MLSGGEAELALIVFVKASTSLLDQDAMAGRLMTTSAPLPEVFQCPLPGALDGRFIAQLQQQSPGEDAAGFSAQEDAEDIGASPKIATKPPLVAASLDVSRLGSRQVS
jgi:hypothetical protein